MNGNTIEMKKIIDLNVSPEENYKELIIQKMKITMIMKKKWKLKNLVKVKNLQKNKKKIQI